MAAVQLVQVPPADVIGNAFVHQYYHILHHSPELVHRFYQDISKLGRPEANGVMSITTTMQSINEKILSLGYGELTAEISTVDSQESHSGGVIVLVTGFLIGNNNIRKGFTQSFFLAPQEKGYFVLNDVFRYVEDTKHPTYGRQDPASHTDPSFTPEQDPSLVQENTISMEATVLSEDNAVEVETSLENGDASFKDEEIPVPEGVDAVPSDLGIVTQPPVLVASDAKTEDVAKKSYASIVKVNAAPFPAPAPASAPVRSAAKPQEQAIALVPPPSSETNISESKASEDSEVEGASIYLKGLPFDATPALLEGELKKFGPIRSGGIQVVRQKGFCFGFVEFEVATAVQSALEASPIIINGCRVIVEEKRSTARGNSRGRFSHGGGSGYRNEGGRGRGGFGSNKAYGRGDFGNRAEFGIRDGRSGFSNRADGYRKMDKLGNNGGRSNRSGGLPSNDAPKTAAPQVSATA